MTRHNPPKLFNSLKDQRMWSIDWAQTTFPEAEFVFHVLLKRTDGEYEDHGSTPTATEAFELRRELVAETGITRYFIRARRLEQRIIEADGDDDAALDYFRDKFNEGVGLEDIPRHLRAGYLAYQRGRRSAR